MKKVLSTPFFQLSIVKTVITTLMLFATLLLPKQSLFAQGGNNRIDRAAAGKQVFYFDNGGKLPTPHQGLLLQPQAHSR